VLTIRRFESRDGDAVRALHRAAMEQADAFLPGPWDADLEDVGRSYLVAGGEFLVGEVDGRVVAMGALRRIDERTAELKRMRVAPAQQRKGVGTRLLEALEGAAHQLRFEALELDTLVRQVAARAFYTKHGYVEMERRLGPAGEEQVVFRKALVSPRDSGLHRLVTVRSRWEWESYHAIRERVLFHARGKFGVYDRSHPDETAADNHPLLLFLDPQPIGVVRVDVRPPLAWLRRVAIVPEYQRRGHGRALMLLAEEFAVRHGCDTILSNVAADAVPFYLRLGFILDGREVTPGVGMRKRASAGSR
jgi:GNAT superfamily N-acetyltransferase